MGEAAAVEQRSTACSSRGGGVVACRERCEMGSTRLHHHCSTTLPARQVSIPIKAQVIPPPPRNRRLLWDQFHGIKYPPGYMPRDNLDIKHDVLDWHGDMLWTNFHTTYDKLRDAGFFVEVLASPWTCFDASRYGALIIVDSEDEFYPEEVAKASKDSPRGGKGDCTGNRACSCVPFHDKNVLFCLAGALGMAMVLLLHRNPYRHKHFQHDRIYAGGYTHPLCESVPTTELLLSPPLWVACTDC